MTYHGQQREASNVDPGKMNSYNVTSEDWHDNSENIYSLQQNKQTNLGNAEILKILFNHLGKPSAVNAMLLEWKQIMQGQFVSV